MAPRHFIVGTDTEVGKTTVSAALLRAAQKRGRQVIPYKPAVSGDLSDSSDHARLARATPELGLQAKEITLYEYAAALAPGIAQDETPFIQTGAHERAEPRSSREASLSPTITACLDHLATLESAFPQRAATLIEGAGGLHVPMPGGTWLPDWIAAFAATPIVVGRAGLGTINHTLLTVEALRTLKLAPPAFVMSCTQSESAEAVEQNRLVLQARLQIPCLGVLPFRHAPDAPIDAATWLEPNWLEILQWNGAN